MSRPHAATDQAGPAVRASGFGAGQAADFETDQGGDASAELIQLLTPEGQRRDPQHPEFDIQLSAEQLRGLYRDMALVRRIDREGNALQRQGQLGIWAPLLGQEAAQIGAGRALQPQDMAFPSYREHGVAWCRGVEFTQIMSLFRGVDHGGWDPRSTGMGFYTIVIGNQCLHAAGYAMGQLFEGHVGNTGDDALNEASMAFFGDGATSQGDIHEGMVWASVYNAPVVFFCQNNHWAISEPVERQSRVPLSQRAQGYGFPGIRVDGNDVLACLAVSTWALNHARNGHGPVFIEAVTYRMDAHTTSDDPTRYRPSEELEAWRAKDPLTRLKTYLEVENLADEEFFRSVDNDADELAASVREQCLNLPEPKPERIFSEVYAAENPTVAGQRDEHLSYLAGFEAPEHAGSAQGGAR